MCSLHLSFYKISVGIYDLVARGIEVKQSCLADCYVVISKCSQFRHADCVDILMILLAIMLSLISGLAVPVEAYLTGRLMNVFISFNTADDISDFFAVNFSNQTCTLRFVQQLLDNASSVNDNIFCNVFEEGNVVNSASMFVCDPTDTLNGETSRFSLYFVYLGIGILVAFFSSHILWTVSASRQSKRIRIAFYKAILNHPIDWFDTTDVSQLGTQFLKYVCIHNHNHNSVA